MKLRRDSDSGILVPQRERIWTPQRERKLQLTGPMFFAPSGPSGPASMSLMRFEAGMLVDTASLRTNTWLSHGTPTLDTSTPKWGTNCLLINETAGPEEIYTTGANFKASASTPFTAEGWFYPITGGLSNVGAGSVYRHAFFCLPQAYPITTGTNANWLWWTATAGGTLGLQNASTTVTGISPNTWHHYCLSFDGLTLAVGVNGTRFLALDYSGSGIQFNTIWLGNMATPCSLFDGGFANYLWTGKLDSMRLTVGAGLYQAATYTVPTADFSDI